MEKGLCDNVESQPHERYDEQIRIIVASAIAYLGHWCPDGTTMFTVNVCRQLSLQQLRDTLWTLISC